MFLAPLFHVGFADFWLADQLNSLTIVFTDLHYSLCYYLPNDSQFHPAESNSAGGIVAVRIRYVLDVFYTILLASLPFLTVIQFSVLNVFYSFNVFILLSIISFNFFFFAVFQNFYLFSLKKKQLKFPTASFNVSGDFYHTSLYCFLAVNVV